MTKSRDSDLSRLGLVADIGGTNARFALADLASHKLTQFERFSAAQFPSLAAAAEAYLAHIDVRPRSACLAVAAPVVGESIQLTNSPWAFDRDGLRAGLGLDSLRVINDFEALALALPRLQAPELHRIGGEVPAPRAPKVVLGPGTGLGVAGLVWSASGWRAVESEGGHVAFAVEDAQEFAMLERLLIGRQRLSAERVLSGPGLEDIYRVLADLRSAGAPRLKAAEVVERAVADSDAIAVAALERFVVWLGRFAGDVALVFGARGGVYLGGGIAPRILAALSTGAFRQAFEAKGRMAGFLAPVPVHVILAKDAGLKGAAVALSMATEPQ